MYVGASLKMYFSHARTVEWLSEIAARPVPAAVRPFVLPQYPSIPAAVGIATRVGIGVGAQDLAIEDEGAYTGEVSGRVLAELGCRYVEVGHAERRRLYGETDAVVAGKLSAAWRNGLVAVLCIGESDRLAPAEASAVCLTQVRAALQPARSHSLTGELIVAYEPIWAIGQPQPAGIGHIRGVCGRLRTSLADEGVKASVIYGGSAGPGLLTDIAPDVDGIFLGRFAHDPHAFRAILDEAAELSA